jgi:phage FluMu gp28-like protein
MPRSIEVAANCRFSTNAAVREARATEFRVLGHAEEAPRANSDCRFPPEDAVTAATPDAVVLSKGVPAPSEGAAPPAGVWLPPRTGVDAAAALPECALVDPGATSANVARDAANEAGEGGGVDRPFSGIEPAVPTGVPRGTSVQLMDGTPASTRNDESRNPETTAERNGHAETPWISAGELPDSAEDVLVAGGGVQGGGLDALVPGDSLDQPDVVGGPVGVGERGAAERVEVEGAVEACAVLPEAEEVAKRPSSDPPAETGDEEGGLGVEALAACPLPRSELPELVPEAVGEEDLLGAGVLGGAFEDAKGDAPADTAVGVDQVADVEGHDLMFAQPGAEREGEDDVVAKPTPVLAGDLEKASKFDLGEGAGRAADDGSIDGHGEAPDERAPDDTQARPAEGGKSKGAGPLIVVKRDEQDLLDWLGTELGFLTGIGHYNEEPIVFEPYQVAFLRSSRKYRWVEKARQVGFSFIFACEAVARCHLREAHTSVMVSYNLEDAKEKVNYARQLAEELPLAFRKKLVTDSKTELGFLSNGVSKRVSRIISNPSKAPRGKKGDLYLDELAHYANDREVYKGSTALILRSRGQLTGCSSPLGRRGVFWEIARQELRKYRAYWRQQAAWWLCRFFCNDVVRASKEAPMMTSEERVRAFGTKDIQDQFDSLLLEDFQQEFECLPAGSLIATREGPRPIEELVPGTDVLSHRGRWQPIERTAAREYRGDVVALRTYHHCIPLRLTPNHPVLAIETSPCRYGRQVRCSPSCRQPCSHKPAALPAPAFVPAGRLTRQHILLYPVLAVTDSPPESIEVRDYFQYPKGYKSKKKIPDVIPISDDFLRLAGYYLAEGSVAKRRVDFCFHRDEDPYHAEVSRAVRSVFGLQTDKYVEGRRWKIGVNSVVVSAIMSELFGRYDAERHIPPTWMNFPTDRLYQLVRAYLNGDGHRRRELVVATSVSRTLIFQLRDILVRVGLVPSIRMVPAGEYNIRRRQGRRDAVYELRVYLHTTNDTRGRRGWNDGRYVYLPIERVGMEAFEGTVHNLQVAEDHSYVAGSHAVHNCQYCDESYSFFPYELILPCTSDDLVLADDFPALAEPEGRLIAGFDVGRKRDLSELAIFEEVGGKKECRLIHSYDRVPFAEQEADLRRMLELLPIARLAIDQSGIGMHLAENLRRDFPQVVPETFTNESKEVWANDFKILLQRQDVVLPKDRELVAQIHSVKKRLTPSGKPSFEVERDEVGRGHADRFWSVALACRKERGPLPGSMPEIGVRVIG